MSSLDISLSSILGLSVYIFITTMLILVPSPLLVFNKLLGLGNKNTNVCASCGIAEVDDVKLEKCNDCDLVKYCGDKCRNEHREKHIAECKKRKAVLHNKKLFTQPDGTHLGECPLCFLPLSLDGSKSMFWTCCSEIICNGCFFTNITSNYHDKVKARACVFCREPEPKMDEEIERRMTWKE